MNVGAPTPADPVLAELFSSRMRAAVLGYLLPRPRRKASLTELSRALDLPLSSLQHECYKLERLGVLAQSREGASRRYRANPDFPLMAPLAALVLRSLGVEAALRAAAEDVSGLAFAALAGSLPPASAPGTLVAVGDLPLEALEDLEARIGVAVATLGSPPPELAFFHAAEWSRRLDSGDAYVAGLLAGPLATFAGAPPARG